MLSINKRLIVISCCWLTATGLLYSDTNEHIAPQELTEQALLESEIDKELAATLEDEQIDQDDDITSDVDEEQEVLALTEEEVPEQDYPEEVE